MDNTSETPAPFITAKQLKEFVHKPVVVAGKVTAVTDRSLSLDDGTGTIINVMRSQPTQYRAEVGMHFLVRGFVSPDSSVTESKQFAPTDLGDKFGTFGLLTPV